MKVKVKVKDFIKPTEGVNGPVLTLKLKDLLSTINTLEKSDATSPKEVNQLNKLSSLSSYLEWVLTPEDKII